MFEVPGSDVVRVTVEEDTARGYHPARYQYKTAAENPAEKSEEAEQTHIVDSSVDSAPTSEVKTSVL